MSRSRVKTRAVVAKDAAATGPGAPHLARTRENTEHPARLRSRARLGPSVAHGLGHGFTPTRTSGEKGVQRDARSAAHAAASGEIVGTGSRGVTAGDRCA